MGDSIESKIPVLRSASKKSSRLPSNHRQTIDAELTKNECSISRKTSVPILLPSKVNRAQTRIPIPCKQYDKYPMQSSPGDFLMRSASAISQNEHDEDETTAAVITNIENTTIKGFTQQPSGDHKSTNIISEQLLSSKMSYEEVTNPSMAETNLQYSMHHEMNITDSISQCFDNSNLAIRCIEDGVDSTIPFMSCFEAKPENLEKKVKSQLLKPTIRSRSIIFNESNKQLQLKDMEYSKEMALRNELCSEMRKKMVTAIDSSNDQFYETMRNANKRLDDIDKRISSWETIRNVLLLVFLLVGVFVGAYFTYKYYIDRMDSNKDLSWRDYCMEWWNCFSDPPKKHEWLMLCFSICVGLVLRVFRI